MDCYQVETIVDLVLRVIAVLWGAALLTVILLRVTRIRHY